MTQNIRKLNVDKSRLEMHPPGVRTTHARTDERTTRTHNAPVGINSRLPSVNHALISPILPHPVL